MEIIYSLDTANKYTVRSFPKSINFTFSEAVHSFWILLISISGDSLVWQRSITSPFLKCVYYSFTVSFSAINP